MKQKQNKLSFRFDSKLQFPTILGFDILASTMHIHFRPYGCQFSRCETNISAKFDYSTNRCILKTIIFYRIDKYKWYCRILKEHSMNSFTICGLAAPVFVAMKMSYAQVMDDFGKLTCIIFVCL